MRRRLFVLLPLLAPAAPPVAVAQEDVLATIGEADRATFRSLIRAQMDAFMANDAERAFSYASPDIQQRFGDAITFLGMVASGYEPVYRPQAVLFQDVVAISGQPAQRVLVQGPDGTTVVAVYPMQRQSDGSWRIDGCFLLASDAQML